MSNSTNLTLTVLHKFLSRIYPYDDIGDVFSVPDNATTEAINEALEETSDKQCSRTARLDLHHEGFLILRMDSLSNTLCQYDDGFRTDSFIAFHAGVFIIIELEIPDYCDDESDAYVQDLRILTKEQAWSSIRHHYASERARGLDAINDLEQICANTLKNPALLPLCAEGTLAPELIV